MSQLTKSRINCHAAVIATAAATTAYAAGSARGANSRTAGGRAARSTCRRLATAEKEKEPNVVPQSVEDLLAGATPDRRGGIKSSMGKNNDIRGKKNAEQVIPEEILSGKYGKEALQGMKVMTEICHLLCVGTHILEEVKDKSSQGLHGFKLDKSFVRTGSNGMKTTMPEVGATVITMLMLQQHFPDDKVQSDEDPQLLAADPEFAHLAADFVASFTGADINAEQVSALHLKCNSVPSEGEMPKRYWAWKPVDTKEEFRGAKDFCSSLALIEDNVPVFSIVGAPMNAFDHPSRTVTHARGATIYWAAKDQGAWAQLIILERSGGVYQGKHGLKGRSLPLKATEKIKRANDMLFDAIGTYQLRIAQNRRLREDIYLDTERVGKILGSEFPKIHSCNSCLKYCWLARGEEDIAWSINQGFYDSRCVERAFDYAAGLLVASEAGADVADLDGNPIEWTTGRLLSNNRGMVATDPGQVPAKGLASALKEATAVSQQKYEERCEIRKEKARILSLVFANLVNSCETEEEIKGAEICARKGMEMLENDEEMEKLVQESINREEPLLGHAPEQPNPFGDGLPIPFSPIDV